MWAWGRALLGLCRGKDSRGRCKEEDEEKKRKPRMIGVHIFTVTRIAKARRERQSLYADETAPA